MPVVLVAAPVMDADRLHAALVSVATAVADPLGLTPADVVVSHVAVGASVVGARDVPAWPVVTLHGGRRDPAAMRAAADAAARAVAAAWSTTVEETWVHWAVRDELS